MRKAVLMGLTIALAACGDGPTGIKPPPQDTITTPVFTLHELPMLGAGTVAERWTAEIAVRDGFAYTTTWGARNNLRGDVVKVWNISGSTPLLLDSLVLTGAGTTSDVQISADGKYLIVSTEAGNNNGIAIFDRSANRAHPALVNRYSSANTTQGVHTVKLARISERHYAFLSIDPATSATGTPLPARLVITDITNPLQPVDVWVRVMGRPYSHDVFVRDGYLFTAEWNDGMRIWDVGGGNRGGSPANPVELGSVHTVNGQVHNIWWFYNPNGEKKYVFIGEEGPAQLFHNSSGDIHVVDVSTMSSPREVAFFHADSTTTSTGGNAGTHNFSMDESSRILYAAYYNGGVRALDVSGDLSACTSAQKAADGRCDLGLMKREVGRALNTIGKPVFVWGVQYANGRVYASDMVNGIEIIDASALKR